jgi:malonyl-CoA/methylmalonyl-CoA synthetase
MINLILRANSFKNREAILSNGNSYSYNDLLKRSAQIASKILDGKEDLKESRIAFIVDPSFEYVAIQWGIWRAGGVAVPLCTKHPLSSLDYVIEDTQAYAIIYSQKYSSLIFPFI